MRRSCVVDVVNLEIYVDDGINNKSGGGRDAALLWILLMWCNDDCEIVDLGCI